ncbi:unnamed protein product, partial [Sphacelaria rigidula]
ISVTNSTGNSHSNNNYAFIPKGQDLGVQKLEQLRVQRTVVHGRILRATLKARRAQVCGRAYISISRASVSVTDKKRLFCSWYNKTGCLALSHHLTAGRQITTQQQPQLDTATSATAGHRWRAEAAHKPVDQSARVKYKGALLCERCYWGPGAILPENGG